MNMHDMMYLSENSTHGLDIFSSVHFGAGVVAGVFGVPLFAWMLVHILFELLENQSLGVAFFQWTEPFIFQMFGQSNRTSDYYGDKAINSTVDNLMALLGWWLGTKISLVASNYRIYGRFFK